MPAAQAPTVVRASVSAAASTAKAQPPWTGSTDTAVAELKQILGPVFESPKPTALLRRIIATMPSDAVICDFFAGSGTLGAVAGKLGRRYVLVDSSPEAIEVMRRRLPDADRCSGTGLDFVSMSEPQVVR